MPNSTTVLGTCSFSNHAVTYHVKGRICNGYNTPSFFVRINESRYVCLALWYHKVQCTGFEKLIVDVDLNDGVQGDFHLFSCQSLYFIFDFSTLDRPIKASIGGGQRKAAKPSSRMSRKHPKVGMLLAFSTFMPNFLACGERYGCLAVTLWIVHPTHSSAQVPRLLDSFTNRWIFTSFSVFTLPIDPGVMRTNCRPIERLAATI